MQRIKKFVSILLSLVMVLGMFAIVPITVSAQASITYTEYSWNGSALVMVDRTVTDYTVVDSNLSTMTGGTYVVNSDTTIENYVTVQKGATANLVVMDGVTLTCKKGIGCGLNKNNEYASLNIFGTGKIVATGKSKVAGIGGDDDETNGNITIHGTTIEATGGKHGAGIGGGEGGKDPNADSPTITIYDGNITATGGIDGAGIGGGDEQPGARTYIYGGTITASSEKHGAGIGGGDEEGTYGVYIYGGTITAEGGSHGAGIGAGEEGGNLRNIEKDGGGVNISGGTVTATGGGKGAGIGGGFDEDMSGTITISGNATVNATGGENAAGMGAGSAGDWSTNGDMDGDVFIKGNPKIVVQGGDGAAGIGAGKAGNMTEGRFVMLGGDVKVSSGEAGAGIGGGRESNHVGGEGGTCYIGGGLLKVFPIPDIYQATPGHDTPVGTYNSDYGEAIGRGHDDSVSGTVIYSYNGDFPSSVPHTGMKVKYAELATPNDFKIAKAGDRSTKSHAYYILDISECDHKDLSGKSVLTYTINGDKHTEKCKYCNYKATVDHHGSDCECGYQSDTCTVHISDDSGLTSATVARNGQFELPDNGDRVQSSNTNPKTYYRVTGWLLSGDTSGKVYENGEAVTVDRDMTFTSAKEDLYQVSFDVLDYGRLHADIKNNETFAAVGETLEFGIDANPGYSVSRVTYRVMTGYDLDNNYNIVYQYSDPVEIQPVEGKYQLTAPAFTETYNNKIVISAEFSGNTENPIYVSDSIENGTVTSDKETAAAGATVTLTAAPDDTYRLDKFNCRAADGSEIELTKVDDTHYTFTMPAMSVSVSAEFELADDFTALQAIIDSTASGGTVTLAFDYTAREGESCLTVPSGKTVTIDLNGYDIDRNTETPLADGNVITNSGTLTITGNGNITGGNSTANGGAILNNGTLTISTGVTISYNSTTEDGGAIYNSGTLTINGGTINNNISAKSGGAISAHSGTITINGGEIKNNRAGSHGGAIYLGNKDGNIATLNLRGGTITGNTVTGSDSQGGGICDVGTLNVSGNPVVKNNTAPAYNKGYNIYLRGGKKVNVTGELTDGAEIGVTAPGGGTGVITSGLSGNGTADSFFSDNPDYYVDVNGSGEGTLAQYYVFTFDANGGSSEQETIRSKTNEIELPACTFTAPEGKIFKAWSVGGTEKQPGETVTIASGYTMTVTAVWADAYHIEIEDGIEHGTVTPDAEYAVEGQTVTLTVTPDEGYVLQELYVMPDGDNPIILDPETPTLSFTMPAQDVAIHAYFAKGTAYVDAKGNDMPAKIALEVTSADTTLGGSTASGVTTSWYYAEGEVTISSRVTVTQNVNLILCDGATLTIPKGIKVAKDTSLTIWQQKGGTGHLVINSVESGKAGIGSDSINTGTAGNKTAGTITINGGILDVCGGLYAAAIGGGESCSGGTITINGCVLIARGGYYAAAIGGGRSGKAGSVTISGGAVNATANWYGAAIGRGHNATYTQDDTVTINGGTVNAVMTSEPYATSDYSVMNGSTFTLNYTDESKYTMSVMAESWSGTVMLSKTFVDEDGASYAAQTVSDNTILNGKTLRPAFDRFAKHSLTLNGDIGVNFYLDLSEAEISQGAVVDFKLNGEDLSSYTVRSTDKYAIDGKTYYKATCWVCAPEMADTITAEVKVNGETVAAEEYSVKTYGDTFLSDAYKTTFLEKGHTLEEYNKIATLIQTMLNYGAYTQVQFSEENAGSNPNNNTTHDAENLANADINYDLTPLTENEINAIEMSAPNKEAMNAKLSGTGLTYYGYTMLLHSETKLRFYFIKDSKNTDITGIHLSRDGVTYDAQNYNAKYAFVEVPAIPAYELNYSYTLTVGEENLGSYSALTYVKDVLENSPDDTTLCNTVTAMYRYHMAAVEWFNNN